MTKWAARAGQKVVPMEAEVGSGMNGARPRVLRLLADPKVTTLALRCAERDVGPQALSQALGKNPGR